MPLSNVIDDVAAALDSSRTATHACQSAVSVLGQHTDALTAALLHVQDHLRCVAASGSWQVFSSVPLGRGVIGRVYASGQPATLKDVTEDPDFIRFGDNVVAEVCVPIVDRAGQPIGALNMEWTKPTELDGWQETLTKIGYLLGARVDELGGPPAETRSEQLLRHAVSLTSANSDAEVLSRACRAAREVTGLAAAVLLLPDPSEAVLAASSPEPRDRPLVSRLAQVAPLRLARLVEQAGHHGSSYTIGDPALLDANGFEPLTEAGVRTMIAVPLGPVGAPVGALVALDDIASRPDTATVNLLELLAAQAATCLEKLATVRQLHLQANSDPLTGLGHSGPFGLRLAAAIPGKTALLAIDVDEFKLVNDTLGHAAGDRVLVELAHALQAALRHGDELFRIGGDEFAAVLEVPSAVHAAAVARRLMAAAAETGRTISIGIAVRAPGEAPEAALHRADKALYAVKRAGRNGYQLAD